MPSGTIVANREELAHRSAPGEREVIAWLSDPAGNPLRLDREP